MMMQSNKFLVIETQRASSGGGIMQQRRIGEFFSQDMAELCAAWGRLKNPTYEYEVIEDEARA